MKRLILGILSLLLMSVATAPAVLAQMAILGTPSNPAANPAADPGSRRAWSKPNARTTRDATKPQKTPFANPVGTLGTPSNPAANPAADPGSRLAPSTPGAPITR